MRFPSGLVVHFLALASSALASPALSNLSERAISCTSPTYGDCTSPFELQNRACGADETCLNDPLLAALPTIRMVLIQTLVPLEVAAYAKIMALDVNHAVYVGLVVVSADGPATISFARKLHTDVQRQNLSR